MSYLALLVVNQSILLILDHDHAYIDTPGSVAADGLRRDFDWALNQAGNRRS